jgi:hypothetical protein
LAALRSLKTILRTTPTNNNYDDEEKDTIFNVIKFLSGKKFLSGLGKLLKKLRGKFSSSRSKKKMFCA